MFDFTYTRGHNIPDQLRRIGFVNAGGMDAQSIISSSEYVGSHCIRSDNRLYYVFLLKDEYDTPVFLINIFNEGEGRDKRWLTIAVDMISMTEWSRFRQFMDEDLADWTLLFLINDKNRDDVMKLVKFGAKFFTEPLKSIRF